MSSADRRVAVRGRGARTAEVVAVLVFVASVAGVVMNMFAPTHFTSRGGEFLFLCEPIVLCSVGGFLVHRRPDHAIGYLTLLAGVGTGVDSPAKAVLNLPLGGQHSALREWAALVDNCTWIVSFAAIVLVLLIYPDGHLLSPRWKLVAGAAIVDGGTIFVLAALAWNSDDYPGIPSPLPTPFSTHVTNVLFPVFFLPFIVFIVLAVASLFLRGRRARRSGDKTTAAQIRWLAWAGAITVVGSALERPITALGGDLVPNLGNIVSELAPFSLTVALVVAITRHGLFEIDRVVSRSVTYVLVTGVLLGLYVAIVAGLSALLPANTGSVVVAAATLAIVALFVPLRRAVQRRVDRRFNRRRLDRAALVEAFAEQLRRDVTHGSNGADLLSVVHRALEPGHASVWLVSQ